MVVVLLRSNCTPSELYTWECDKYSSLVTILEDFKVSLGIFLIVFLLAAKQSSIAYSAVRRRLHCKRARQLQTQVQASAPTMRPVYLLCSSS